jgi:L-ascorbate metabolism protein UlaG (beta-lactamase superfamily)
MAESGISFRWLGVAGFALGAEGRLLLIDPYVTRIPFFRQWIGKVHPNEELLRSTFPRCDSILITHSHYDHLMDAPVVARHTGARVYGSANTCALLAVLGVPREQVHQVAPGRSFSVDGIRVDVHPAPPPPIPVFRPGPVRGRLRAPLSAREYRMDVNLSYLITAQGVRVLTDPGMVPPEPLPAELLFLAPHLEESIVEEILRRVKPRLVVPTHWDNMWRTLLEPLSPALRPPRIGVPLTRRIDVERFRHLVEDSTHGARVFIPERLEEYDLAELMG